MGRGTNGVTRLGVYQARLLTVRLEDSQRHLIEEARQADLHDTQRVPCHQPAQLLRQSRGESGGDVDRILLRVTGNFPLRTIWQSGARGTSDAVSQPEKTKASAWFHGERETSLQGGVQAK